MRIVDASTGNPLSNSYIDFNYGYGPVIAADTDGNIDVSIYLPDHHQLGDITVYPTIQNGRSEYKMYYNTNRSPSPGDIGDVEYSFPEFSPVTVTLSPESGSTDLADRELPDI